MEFNKKTVQTAGEQIYIVVLRGKKFSKFDFCWDRTSENLKYSFPNPSCPKIKNTFYSNLSTRVINTQALSQATACHIDVTNEQIIKGRYKSL